MQCPSEAVIFFLGQLNIGNCAVLTTFRRPMAVFQASRKEVGQVIEECGRHFVAVNDEEDKKFGSYRYAGNHRSLRR